MILTATIRLIVLTSTVLLLSSKVLAADDDYIFAQEEKYMCDTGGMVQMGQCMADHFKKLDQELNDLYKELTRVLVEPKGIRNAQRAWLRFRDAECSDDVMQLGAGSLYPYAYNSCMIEFTKERIRHLRWHLAQDCNGCPPRK